MIKSEFGQAHQHSISWSGTDTQVHVNGNVSTEEMYHLINMLEMAIEARQSVDCETTQVDAQTQI